MISENQIPVLFRYRWGWHLLFWVVIFIMYWLTNVGFMGYYREEFMWSLTLLPVRMAGTYLFIYLILPFATRDKKFIPFAVLTLVHSFLYGLAIWATYKYTNLFPEMMDLSKKALWDAGKIFNKLVANYGIPVMATAILIFKKWYADELKNKKLAEEKLAAELNFLKSQVHPHFLFNTLNNLYALTLIRSEKTSDIVLKLSDLLDYMIYKSNAPFVSLEKELETLQGYMELEKMRYSDRLDFGYTVTGDPSGHEIAPLILLPFIENCFKHGASNDRHHPRIRISVEISPATLTFRAVNSVPEEVMEDASVSKGIGLKNVKRRLELIYPGRHELTIKREAREFRVGLTINQ